ncbi:hypothetical protein [Algoriphagus namhaensis]
METNFTDIQQLWQSQKAAHFDVQKLIGQLQRLEKKQKREWIIALALLPMTLIVLALVLPWRESSLATTSLVMIGLGMVWMVWLSAKSRVVTTRDSEDFSNQEFIQKQLGKLRLRYTILQKHILIYGGLIALAVNISYLVVLEPLSPGYRLLSHLNATLFIALVMYGSIRFKKRKYDKELKPMIEHLEKLLETGAG